ncbi:MAG: hypothetical protein KGI38_07965 [Thaumarchaeota archaeon]|nr:hypothetical protein [Nitrososphaerota archaeon]
MIATYLVLKIAMQAIIQECNKMALAADSQAVASAIKERIATLEIEFSSGAIDVTTYERRAAEIVEELKQISIGGLQAEGPLDEL